MSHLSARIRRQTLTLACLAASLFAQSPAPQFSAASSVPAMVKFGGTVAGAPGRAVGLTFALYKEQQGGAPLWLETQSVAVDAAGHYNVQLGATLANGLPRELFASGEARWLGVQQEGRKEQPRVLLLSVPYALKAADAETLGGLPPSAFALANTVPIAASTGSVNSAGAPNTGSAPPPNAAVTGLGTVNFVPLWDTTSDIVNSAISQTGTGTTAKIGINTAAPTVTLDVKGASTIRGALTLPTTGAATVATGKNSQPLNLSGSAFNSGTNTAVNQTFRLQTEPVGNDTANSSGKLSLLYYSGASAAAETGLSIASNGRITFSDGQTFPGAGTISGVSVGPGLIGGGTSGNVSVSLTGSCGVGQVLQWTSVTWLCANLLSSVTAGTDVTVSTTNGNATVNLDTTKIPQLNGANTFTGSQTVNGNLSATGVVTGSSFQIGSNLFAFGSYANFNAFLGFSGNTTTTGTSNTANGYAALGANTTGVGNTASGLVALTANTTGGYNTADGLQALFFNTTGTNNTATGATSLPHNTLGSYNTVSGSAAMYYNTSGNQNTAIGNGALWYNATGSNNTALGVNAGVSSSNTALNNATAIGANAEVGESNALILGSINGVNNSTADTLVGIGTTTPAAKLDVHGTANFTGLITFAGGQTFPGAGTIFGVTAGTGMTGGGTSGSVTLNVDTTKVVTGITAGTGLTGGGTGGVPTLNLDTTKVPQLAAANTFTNSQTVSGNLTATGVVSGSSFQIGNTLFGYGNPSIGNAYVGFAGGGKSGGSFNTGVGVGALAATTSSFGYNNVAIGFDALVNNVTGDDNTATGYSAMSSNFGSQNSAYGSQALLNTISGIGDTGIGIRAMLTNTTGHFDTALGYEADVASQNLSNATAVGAFAQVSASNAMVLGSINGVNGANADALVGIGITNPSYKLHVGNLTNTFRVEGPATSGTGGMAGSFGGYGDFGIDAPGVVSGRFVVKESGSVGVGVSAPTHIFQVGQGKGAAYADSWTTYSSRRWKTNIQTLPNGLAKVEQLRGVSYDLKGSGKHEIGVIAEEVGAVVPEVVSFEENGKDAQGVDYSRLTAVLIEAVKEQQRQIAEQQRQIRAQQRQISRLSGKVGLLESALRTTAQRKTRSVNAGLTSAVPGGGN